VFSKLSPFGGWVEIFPTYNLCDNGAQKKSHKRFDLIITMEKREIQLLKRGRYVRSLV
jgi:hypothetical protein